MVKLFIIDILQIENNFYFFSFQWKEKNLNEVLFFMNIIVNVIKTYLKDVELPMIG